jgi:hypothetical protein
MARGGTRRSGKAGGKRGGTRRAGGKRGGASERDLDTLLKMAVRAEKASNALTVAVSARRATTEQAINAESKVLELGSAVRALYRAQK